MSYAKYFLVFINLLSAFKTIKMEVLNSVKPFTCAGKVIGGYYADIQSNCQMFHVCTLGGEGEIRDIVFRCVNGTVFKQETRVCERESEVVCSLSEDFYFLNNELYGPGIIPDSANILKITDEEGTIGLTSGLRVETHRSPLDSAALRDKTLPSENLIRFDSHEDPFYSCEDRIPGVVYADLQDDCRSYFFCQMDPVTKNIVLHRENCPLKFQSFDSLKGICTSSPFECSSRGSSDLGIAGELIHLYESTNDQLEVLCLDYTMNGLIGDTASNCSRYYECIRTTKGKLMLQLRECPESFFFSQTDGSCVKEGECTQGVTLFLSKDNPLVLESTNPVENSLREKRNAPLEDRNRHGEATRGSGIIGDSSQLIDSQSSQNGFNSRHSKSNEQKKCRIESPKPHVTFEICEIGDLIVSSLLPVVRKSDNGNNSKDDETSTLVEEVINATSLASQNEDAEAPSSLTLDDTSNPQEESNTTSTPAELEETTPTSLEASSASTSQKLEESTTTTTPQTTTTTTTTTPKPSTSEATTTTPEPDHHPNGDTVTSFTCKGKELNKLFPDRETECRVFHYCSPGEERDLVFDFKFECKVDFRFDVTTQKCQHKSLVECKPESTTTSSSASSSTSSSTTTPSTTITSTSSESSISTTSATTSSSATPLITTLPPSTTASTTLETMVASTSSSTSELTSQSTKSDISNSSIPDSTESASTTELLDVALDTSTVSVNGVNTVLSSEPTDAPEHPETTEETTPRIKGSGLDSSSTNPEELTTVAIDDSKKEDLILEPTALDAELSIFEEEILVGTEIAVPSENNTTLEISENGPGTLETVVDNLSPSDTTAPFVLIEDPANENVSQTVADKSP